MSGSLLTPGEVATWLRTTERRVREWAIAGKLPSIRMGRRFLRFRREDIESFINGTEASHEQRSG